MDEQKFIIDLDIEDNRVILTAANHEQAILFAKGIVALFASMGREHIIFKDDYPSAGMN